MATAADLDRDTNYRVPNGFFSSRLSEIDPAVFEGIKHELEREQTQIELIASENIVSKAVLEAQGSVLTNKYAEGYPGRRYYQGCAPSDEVETLAIERPGLHDAFVAIAGNKAAAEMGQEKPR